MGRWTLRLMTNVLPKYYSLLQGLKTNLFFCIISVFGILVFAAPVAAKEVRIAALQFGTVNWVLDTVKLRKLDIKHNFKLRVIPLASSNGAKIALQGGSADIVTTDWTWISRRRAERAAHRPGALAGGPSGRPDGVAVPGRPSQGVGGATDPVPAGAHPRAPASGRARGTGRPGPDRGARRRPAPHAVRGL